MENLYCIITEGKPMTVKLKLFLRLLNFVILAIVKQFWGIDWVIVVGLVIVVADLDSIAEALQGKFGKDCKNES